MSMDPTYAEEQDRALREDEERRAAMTENPEVPERSVDDGWDADDEREHVLGSEEVVGADEGEEEVAPTYATPDVAAPDVAEPAGYGTPTGFPAEDRARAGYGTDRGSVTNGLGDDVVMAPDQNADFRTRWHDIQAEFIDDPQRAAEDADHLVAEITKAFAAQAEERRNQLASSWHDQGTHDTEELRLVMRHYRGLVDHMLDQ